MPRSLPYIVVTGLVNVMAWVVAIWLVVMIAAFTLWAAAALLLQLASTAAHDQLTGLTPVLQR